MGLDISVNKVRMNKDEKLYFRKVNFLVSFFEEMLGHEVYNCEGINIEKEWCEELINRCNKVLEDHSLAEKLLPTMPGFFFGDTEYNNYYFQDVENVKTEFTKLLDDFEVLHDDEYFEFEIWY